MMTRKEKKQPKQDRATVESHGADEGFFSNVKLWYRKIMRLHCNQAREQHSDANYQRSLQTQTKFTSEMTTWELAVKCVLA